MGITKDIGKTVSALGLILASQASMGDLTKSGVAGYVRPPATSFPAGGAPARQLQIGAAVFHNERIVTGPTGRAHLIMLDRSTLTVGPNSEITIEKFDYNAKERTGDFILRAAKGFFRLVGGFVSKKKPVRLKMAMGTIGIRGGIVSVSVNADGSIDALFLYGDQATWEGDDGQTAELNRGGGMMQIQPDGSFEILPIDGDMLRSMLEKNSEGQKENKTEFKQYLRSVTASTGTEFKEQLIYDTLINTSDLDLLLKSPQENSDDNFDRAREAFRDIAAAGSGG